MCRLLAIKSNSTFKIRNYLEKFAHTAKNSKEYQGHGWGCAYLKDNNWKIYKNIKPVWEDDLKKFDSTHLLIAHARSAFRDEGIEVSNNMPFLDGKYAFVFNGELHGVRIKEKGRIGAEKIFNFLKRFNSRDGFNSIEKGIRIIKDRTRYIKAMNFIITDKHQIFVHSMFSTEPEYFTMYIKKTKSILLICSEKFKGEKGWKKFENKKMEVFK